MLKEWIDFLKIKVGLSPGANVTTCFMLLWNNQVSNGTEHIRNQCMKTIVLSCHRCLINSDVEKNEQHLNMYYNIYHQMSLSKSKH